jgi:DNA-binding XRE family transcriptional regulator
MMSFYAGEEADLHPQRLVHYNEGERTYGLSDPTVPGGGIAAISYCPWCAAKLRRIRARGLKRMTPTLCREARSALSLSHRDVADAIGESLATVFHYEAGKPTDEAVVAKLLTYFQEFQIVADGRAPVGLYQL